MPQMVAHHTAGGCNLRPGDLLGTGTLSHAVSAGILVVLHMCLPLALLTAAAAKQSSQEGTWQQRCKPYITNPLQAPDGCGCLLEATRNGAQPLQLQDGSPRAYLSDGDTVTLRGWCQGDGYRVGFGDCIGQLLSARG